MPHVDTILLETLIDFFDRNLILIRSRDKKWAVADQSNGLSIVTEWHPNPRAAIAAVAIDPAA